MAKGLITDTIDRDHVWPWPVAVIYIRADSDNLQLKMHKKGPELPTGTGPLLPPL